MNATMRLSDVPFEETLHPEPPAPPLGDLFGAGDARAAAFRYWVRDGAEGAMNVALHHLFATLPLETASDLGARIAPFFQWRNRNTLAQARMEAAIARLRPELDTPALRKPVIDAWWRNTIRTLAEFAQVDRLPEGDRVTVAGQEHEDRVTATGRPIIVISAHMSSWEGTFRFIMQRRIGGRDWFGMYSPQPNRFDNRIIQRIRRRSNAYAFPPTAASLRRIRSLLADGVGNLALLVDAPSEGEVHFPLFGRPLPDRCSLRVGIGLARRTKAIMLPGFFVRTGAARFHGTWLPPVDPLDYPADETGIQAMARTLSDGFEPSVRAQPEQWYMLDRIKFRADQAPASPKVAPA